ncbi:Zinc metalloprotease [Frankliniella fusca]|uniref:Zinc metalloprotease n=1 Tax=Frankliniella fusca TaxID=407009 RepID=A0AAE1LP55_9NEOP|nr:Zinc metalloprotease [Frankliniella fusca]
MHSLEFKPLQCGQELMVLLLALGAVLGEPAFRRQQAQQAAEEAADAPYAPSGWKPAGQRLELPPRQYGAPAPKEEELDATTEPATEEPPAEPKQPDSKPTAARSEKQQQQQQQVAQGEYYVILPDGRLQKVQFAAKLEASPEAREGGQEGGDDADGAEPAPAPAPAPRAARPKAANRPVPRAQPASQRQQQQAEVPAVPVVQADYLVVLPDGRLQEVQYFGRLEAAPAGKQDGQQAAHPDADEEAAPSPAAPRRSASKATASRARPQAPQAQRQQVQQPRPVVLLPQQEAAVPSSFVAELRFMEVPPITGPVYSYSQPLVRVQRGL